MLVILPSTLIFLHLAFVITIPTLALAVLILVHKITPYFKNICEVFFSLYFSLVCLTTEFCFTFISPYLKLSSTVTYQYDQIPYSYQPTVYASVENPQLPNRCVGASILLDTGSIYSYICSGLAEQLNCKVVTYGTRKAAWVKLKNLSLSSTELEVLLWVHESLQFKHCPRPSPYITQIVNSTSDLSVVQNEYSNLPKTYNIILGSDLLSSVLYQSSADKIHHNLVAHQTNLGWVVQGANLNLSNPWNVLQNKTFFNLQPHFVNIKKLTCVWFICLALLWLDGLPFYLTLK